MARGGWPAASRSKISPEMLMPTVISVAFALISAIGAYLIVGHHHGRKAAAWSAGLTVLFFVLLFLAFYLLLRDGRVA
jgi:hypothetical protein